MKPENIQFRAALENLGWTQRFASAALGVTLSCVSTWAPPSYSKRKDLRVPPKKAVALVDRLTALRDEDPEEYSIEVGEIFFEAYKNKKVSFRDLPPGVRGMLTAAWSLLPKFDISTITTPVAQ